MSVRVSQAALFALATRRAISPFKATILIAEDSADSREMMQVLLEKKGYEVCSANDGISALDMALNRLPDIILVDLGLPGLDGLMVAREIRLHPELNGVPIIMLSGHDVSRYGEAARAAGCDDYLMKPIDFDRLDQILENIPGRLYRAAAG